MMPLEQRLIDDLTDKLRARNLQRTAAVKNAYQALHDFYDARKRQREDVGPRNKRVSLTELLVSVLPQVNGHVVKTRTLRELVLRKYPLRSAGNTQLLLSCKELGRKGYLRKVTGGWMKNVALLAVWLLLAGFAHAGQVQLAWQASPTPNVTYALYATTNTASLPVRITTGTNLVASLDLPAGRWGFWATAVDANGLESLPSNTVVHDVPAMIVIPAPPVPPSNLRKLLIEIPLDPGSTNWVTNGVVRYRLEP